MAEQRFVPKTPKKTAKKQEETATSQDSTHVSEEKRRKLEELDKFIDGVLEEAGEEFLDEFKQVEGE
ncbi:MAG: hypothetical protein AB1646_09455 [Thermodesulfobacteriota bacterium]